MKTYILKQSNRVMRTLAYLLIGGIVSYSCNDIIQDVDVPNTDPQLVVHAHITTDDSLVLVTVTNSHPMFNSPPAKPIKHIGTASVILKAKTGSVKLAHDYFGKRYLAYHSLLNLKPGDEIFIEVNAPNYESVKGKTTIPIQANKSQEIVRVFDYVWDGDTTKRIEVRFRDIPNQENYYHIFCEYMSSDIFYWTETYNVTGNEFISDVGNDGQYFTAIFETYVKNLDSVRVHLYTTDKAYFLFHRSVANKWQGSGGGPFGEPVILYSNIENGLGVLSSHLRHIIVSRID